MQKPIETLRVVLGDQLSPRIAALADFIDRRLPGFGDWQDAMRRDEPALFADGGILGSKPYTASGAHIPRMRDYCRGCAYDVTQATGRPAACPLNFLCWDFIARHAHRLAANPRMAMPLRAWRRMDPERQATIRAQARAFLATLKTGGGGGIVS